MSAQSTPTLFASRIRLFGRGTPLIHVPQVAVPTIPIDVVVNPVARPIVTLQELTVMSPRMQKSQVLRRSIVTLPSPANPKRSFFGKHKK